MPRSQIDLLLQLADAMADCATVITYDTSNNPVTITKTTPDGVQYRRTLTWVGGNMTAASAWVRL